MKGMKDMKMKKADKKTSKAISKVERVKPEVMPREKTLDQAVEQVRRDLDTMDGLDQQHKFGEVYIGMQLLAIKEKTDRQQFRGILENSILRPSFSMRTAQRYMQAGNTARVRLLQSGKIDMSQIWGVAPSEMSMERRNELQGILEKVLGKTTVKQLTAPKDGDDAPAVNGKDVEREAITKGWKRLANVVWNQSQCGTWAQLMPNDRAEIRGTLKAAMAALEK